MKKTLGIGLVLTLYILLTSLSATAGLCNGYNCHVSPIPNGKTGPHYFYIEGDTSVSPCAPCHKPHNAGNKIPLWNDTNKYDDGAIYQKYISPTGTLDNIQDDNINPPSEACMACHDGMSESTGLDEDYFNSFTLLLGKPMGTFTINYSKANHPIGIEYNYNKDTGLNNNVNNGWIIGNNGNFKLINGKVECLTCHDPHKGVVGEAFIHYPDVNKLLRTSNINTFCNECHINK